MPFLIEFFLGINRHLNTSGKLSTSAAVFECERHTLSFLHRFEKGYGLPNVLIEFKIHACVSSQREFKMDKYVQGGLIFRNCV